MEVNLVEQQFLRAIEIDPSHAWWWSRYISFLITRGRTTDATNAWGDCLDALDLPTANADPRVYENLHLWVARLLIHRGQLDFARQVIDAVQSSPPACPTSSGGRGRT